MLSVARHIIAILIATALGTMVYILALKIVWGEDISHELSSVVFAAGTSLCIVYPLIYLPAFRLLARKLGGAKPLVLFPILGIILGIVPVVIINLRWGGSLAAVLSPESQLFGALFITVGAALGAMFPFVDQNSCKRQPANPHDA